MASIETVKRALAALATRTDTARGPYAAVIDEADAARADLPRAAGFLDAVGLDRLGAATEAAADDDETDLAARGREALRAYRALRRAATEADPGPSEREPKPEAPTDRADQFRPGGGTPKCGSGQLHSE